MKAGWIAALIVAAVTYVPAAAGDLYVKAGAGAGGDGSRAKPFAEIQPAVNAAKAGDTIHVAAGSYAGVNFLDKAGEPGKPIRLIGETSATGELLAKIDLNTGKQANNNDGINIQRSKHLEIAHVELIGTGNSGRLKDGSRASRAGFGIHQYAWQDGSSWKDGQFVPVRMFRDIHIHHCKIHDFGDWGVLVGACDEIHIHHCEVYGSRTEHGIYLSNPGANNHIHHNYVHDNGSSGIQINATNIDEWTAAPYGGVSVGNIVENNIILHNGIGYPGHKDRYPGGGAALNFESMRASIVRNNLLLGNRATGIALWNGNAGGHGCHFNFIVNNTVIMPREGRSALLIDGDAANSYSPESNLLQYNTVSGNTIVNNVFWHAFIDDNADGMSDDTQKWNGDGNVVKVISGDSFARTPGNILNHNLYGGRFRIERTNEGATTFMNAEGWKSGVAGQRWDEKSIFAARDQFAAIFSGAKLTDCDELGDAYNRDMATRFAPAPGPGSVLVGSGVASVLNQYAIDVTAKQLAGDAKDHPANEVPPFHVFNANPKVQAPWPTWSVPSPWVSPEKDLFDAPRGKHDVGAIQSPGK